MKKFNAVRAELYINQARDWIESQHFFGCEKLTALKAVAEYLANQEGYTTFGGDIWIGENDD